MSGKHILFLPSWYPTASTPIGGIFFQDQAVRLVEGGSQVGVIAAETVTWRGGSIGAHFMKRGGFTAGEEEGVSVIRDQQANVWPRRWRARRWIKMTLRLAQRYVGLFGVPDILHAQSLIWGGYAGLLLARRWRRPLVVTEHSTAFFRNLVTPWEKEWIRDVCRAPTRVLAVSPTLAKAVSKISGEDLPAIVPNVVDTDFFRPPPYPMAAPVEVLCVAMLDKKKGVDVLLEAISLLRARGQAVRLRVIGEGPERAFLEARSAHLGLDAVAGFTGVASRTEVRKAMWSARVFVLPSRVETFGLVLAEAMACGLPVVATRCGGPEDFVVPPFGWLVPVDDSAALAVALAEALSRESGAVAAIARSHAVTQFGPEAFRARLAQVYADAKPH